MIKYFIISAMFIHGLTHLIGFSKALGYGELSFTSTEISVFSGFFWLISCLLFTVASLLLLLKNENWIWVAIMASLLSQILIFMFWNDAKFGTIPNLIIISAVIFVVAGKDISIIFRD